MAKGKNKKNRKNKKKKQAEQAPPVIDRSSKAWLNKNDFAVLRSFMKLHFAFKGVDVDAMQIVEANTELNYVSMNARFLVGKGYRFDALYRVEMNGKWVKVVVEVKTDDKKDTIAQMGAYVSHLYQYELEYIAGRNGNGPDQLYALRANDYLERFTIIVLNMSGKDWGSYVYVSDIYDSCDAFEDPSLPIRVVSLGHLLDEEREVLDREVLLADEIFRTMRKVENLEKVAEKYRDEMENVSLELFAICSKFLNIDIAELMDMPGFEEKVKEEGIMCVAVEQLKEKATAFYDIKMTLENGGYMEDVLQSLRTNVGLHGQEAEYYVGLYKKDHPRLAIKGGSNNKMYNKIPGRFEWFVNERTGRECIVERIATEFDIDTETAGSKLDTWQETMDRRILKGWKAPDCEITAAITHYLNAGWHDKDIVDHLKSDLGCTQRQAREAVTKYLESHPGEQILPGYRKDYDIYNKIAEYASEGYCENDIIDKCMSDFGLTRQKAKTHIAGYMRKNTNAQIRPGYRQDYDIYNRIAGYASEGYCENDIIDKCISDFGLTQQKAKTHIAGYMRKNTNAQIRPGYRQDYDIYNRIAGYASEGYCENDIIDKCISDFGLTQQKAKTHIAGYMRKNTNAQIRPGYRKDYEQKELAFNLIDVLKELVASQADLIHRLVAKLNCSVNLASAFLDEYQKTYGAIPRLR